MTNLFVWLKDRLAEYHYNSLKDKENLTHQEAATLAAVQDYMHRRERDKSVQTSD